MPRKPVTIRRWEVAAAFAVLAASFTIGLVLVTRASDTARHAAAEAQLASNGVCRVARRNTATLRELLELAQKNSRVSLRQDPARLANAQRFYRQALALLPAVNCDNITLRLKP